MARKSGSRYLSILRGKRGQAAKTQLLSYLDGSRQVSYPGRSGNRPERELVWVDPFGIPLNTGAKLGQYVDKIKFATVSAFVAGFVSDTKPAAVTDQIMLPGIRAPRAAITLNRTETGTSDTSKLTGLQYKKYGGNTVSVPFGEGAAATEKSEDAVFRIILGRVKENSARNTCSFVPGSYSA